MNNPLQADTILHGPGIYKQISPPRVVEAIALNGDIVIAAGSAADLEGLRGPGTEWIELKQGAVLPGLTDAHIHFEQYARSLDRVDCNTQTLEECLERLAQRAQQLPVGSWIEAHGWDQNRWGRWPTAEQLDRVTPHHPVYMTARSLHAAAANSAALRAAGVEANQADPKSGELQRDADGRVTGIMFEEAHKLVTHAIPSLPLDRIVDLMEEAQETLWRLGLTGLHDFDGDMCFRALQSMQQRGTLGLRTVKQLRVEYLDHAQELGLRSGFGNDMLRLGNVKIFADGALGPRTAAMFEPYEDEPGSTGLLLLDEEEITEIAQRAAQAGWPMTIHAIGDRANHHALNALEALRQICDAEGLPWSPRHRIEHVQLLKAEDVHRLSQLDVIASMQPIHATSDRDMAEAGWGERSKLAYAWKTLLDSGAAMTFGSDAPVESPNPFWGIHAAVNRTAPTGEGPQSAWYPVERISLQAALHAYTQGAARAAGFSDRSGRLGSGCFADLIVLPRDPFQMPAEELATLKPSGVMVAGRWRMRSF